MLSDTKIDKAAVRSALQESAQKFIATRLDAPNAGATLRAVVAGVLVAVPSAAAASITLIDKHGALSTHAPSNERVSAVDRMQAAMGEGPCIDALDTNHDDVTDAPDLTTGTAWR